MHYLKVVTYIIAFIAALVAGHELLRWYSSDSRWLIGSAVLILVLLICLLLILLAKVLFNPKKVKDD